MGKRTDFFKNKMMNNAVCAEVGVRDGDNAQRIVDANNPELLYLIDPWDTLTSWWGEDEGSVFTQKRRDAYHQSYLNTCEKFEDNDKVKIIKKHSVDAAKDFDDNYFDWVYIDGDHRYEYVLEDLNCWLPKVKNGGSLVGHDWCHKQVEQAVKEFLKSNPKCKLTYTSSEQGHDGHSEYLIKVEKD